jgi:outer membrane lipoprotein-sorting protein
MQHFPGTNRVCLRSGRISTWLVLHVAVDPRYHGASLSVEGAGRFTRNPMTTSRLVVLSILCLLASFATGPLVAQEVLPDPRQEDLGPTERVDALLERVRIEQGRITSLQATFVQNKQSAMLLEPVEATGEFAFAAQPDRVRWEYRTPNPISILIVDEEMTTWYRDIQQAERIGVSSQSQRVLKYLGAGSSMEDLLQYFELTLTVPTDPDEPYIFDLEPRFDKVAKRLQGMTVWVHPEYFLPTRLRYVEADGDVTDMQFGEMRINQGVPEDYFELELPNTVEVRQVDPDRSAGLL